MVKIVQSSLSGGEVSDAIGSRVDIDKYRSSVAKAENVFPQVHGGMTNRAGLQFIGFTKGIGDIRLIPFSFSTEQTYVLEMGPYYMRVIKDGGYVLDTSKVATITGVTQANPAVVTTSSAHGFTAGHSVYLSSIGGMTQLNGRTFTVKAVLSSTTFSLEDSVGNALDSTGFTAYTSGGSAQEVYEIALPYSGPDILELNYTQSADVMTLVHPSFEPRDLTRTDHDAWTLTTLTFAPDQAAPTSVSASATTTGSTTYRYVVTAVNAETLEESLQSNTATVTNAAATNWDNNVTWTAAANAQYYNVYREKNGIFGFIGRAGSTSFRDDFIEADTLDSPPEGQNPFVGADNYPSAVTYHQQRRIFANTINSPQTFYMTQTANISNMSFSSPLKDDDSITATIASRQVNAILNMISLRQLILLTSGGEWTVDGVDGVITPSGLKIEPQSYFGSVALPPIIAGDIVLYMQPGQVVRDMGYKFETDSYTGNDLSVLARHLFDYNTVVDWSFGIAPHSILWCVRSDGIVLSLVYSREQNVFGWSTHSTLGSFKSVACVREDEEDIAYFVVERNFNGVTKKTVERMSTRDFDDLQDSFFVDSGLSLDNPVTITGFSNTNPVVITTATSHGLSPGDTVDIAGIKVSDDAYTRGFVLDTDVNGTGYTVGAVTSTTFELINAGTNVDGTLFNTYHSGGEARKALSSISGLWHLEGMTVTALANGRVQADLTVTNGSITLPSAASRIHVGLPYQAEIKTLRIDNGQLGDSIQGKTKKIGRLTVRFERSLGGWYGPDLDHMRELKYGLAPSYGQPPEWLTGDKDVMMSPSWNKDGQIVLQQRDPLPMTVLSIIPDVVVGGN